MLRGDGSTAHEGVLAPAGRQFLPGHLGIHVIAVSKGEVTEAQGYFSARVVDMLGKDKLSAQLSRQATYIQNCGGIKNVEVKLDGEGEVRSGKVTLTYAGNCRPDTEKAELVKEDGSWKIAEK